MNGWPFSRDRLGRLRCGNCGLVCSKMAMEYPEGNEEIYVCITCFKDGYDAWIPVEDADEDYPDWNKAWREKWKKRRKQHLRMGLIKSR